MKVLLLLSGPTAVGKSEVSKILIASHSFLSFGSGAFLREYARSKGFDASRQGLQQLGDSLDDETDYRWIVDDVALPKINEAPHQQFWIVDSVRKERQVAHFRDSFGEAVMHVHFDASEEALRQRYEKRAALGEEYSGNTPYSIARESSNEIAARSLKRIAEQLIDLTTVAPNEAAEAILAKIRSRGINASDSSD